MNKLAVVLALVTLASTGCAGMGTKRPVGGASITKTAPSDEAKSPTDSVSGVGDRADLGER